MKKTIIKLITLALSTIMLISLTACGNLSQIFNQNKIKLGLTEEDYADMIDEFVSDGLNTFELTIGEEHAPDARIWLQAGFGSTYSSDETVVTVTDGGKVNAVGEGSAYIIITAYNNSLMYEVYRYDVYAEAAEADLTNLPIIDGIDFAEEIENFNSTPLNTYELKVGEAHSPTASVWVESEEQCHSSDESVVTVNSKGNVTAVGKGTAYIIIESGVGSMFQIYKYIVK